MTVPDSVWELPTDFDWKPQAVCDYINREHRAAEEEGNYDAMSVLFNLAAGLYWYCADWHGGMSSPEYSIMSAQLAYQPGPSECSPGDGPPTDDNEDDHYVYCELQRHNQEVTDTAV